MSDRQSQLNPFWKTFPQPLRSALQSIPQNSGRLDAWHCSAAMKAAGMSLEDLMVKLLPAARLYARVPISNFKVGAVVRGCIPDKPDGISLFLGANIEFAGQSLTETIHAEQTAVVNARQQGSVQIEAIAVSAAPCGRCRQFLYELDTRQLLTVIVQQADGNDTSAQKLSDLLPQAFGPLDLNVEAGLMSWGGSLPELNVKRFSDDPLVIRALSAARRTYAPYTRNVAGCAIQVGGQKVFTGSYVENAAFNPSLSPLHTALIQMNMDAMATEATITRAVLVEKPTTISQRGVCELLLGSLAPDVRLAYHEIR
ncbi:MAG: cytidine deaminase [Desulfobacterales bacterium]|jgi:cytidine deaminase